MAPRPKCRGALLRRRGHSKEGREVAADYTLCPVAERVKSNSKDGSLDRRHRRRSCCRERGVSGHFLFDGFRLALLRPSYRGRRAGVDSFRVLRLLMFSPHFVIQHQTTLITEGSVLVLTIGSVTRS
jgi:hypothetical protein